MSAFRSFRSLGLAAVLAGTLVAGSATAEPSNKWRIQVSSDADSDGVIVFALAPENGAPITVNVPVRNDTDENDIADLIAAAMRSQLGRSYRVEVDDGEDVLVKKRMGAANFDLRVVEQSVQGVRINLDRE